MYYLIVFGAIIVLIIVLLWFWIIRRFRSMYTQPVAGIMPEKFVYIKPEQVKQHQDNLQKVLALFSSHPQLTSQEVEQALGVPDAVVARYFDELEHLGKIQQVSLAGQSAHYILK